MDGRASVFSLLNRTTLSLGSSLFQLKAPVLQAPAKGSRSVTICGNKNEGKGVFAPIVVVTRNVVGVKRFNQIRGKAIALHSQVWNGALVYIKCSDSSLINPPTRYSFAPRHIQVITSFCKQIGADGKQKQGLIRLAKKNGEKLGFLA